MFKQKYLIIILTLLISLIWAENNLITINNYPTTNAITIPKLLNYQGKLTNLAGQPVTDSIYSITFRLYNVSLGGSEFWTETQNVQTNQGIFNVILGSVNPIESIPQSGNCYLEMQVNPNPAMTPRIRITSSAYAYLAKKADTANYAIATNVQYVDSAGVSANAHKLQGKDTVALDLRYVNENQSNAITTTMIVNNAVDNTKLSANAVTTDKIQDNTITRNDVALNFKAPYADTADYTRNVNVQYVDSARIAANAHNAYKLQGKDTVALSNKFVDEGQTNAITSVMIVDNAITSAKIQDGTIQLIDLAFTPATRPLTPPVSNAEIQDNAITSSKIQDGTILRQDVASNFKSPYADTADYARNVNVQYVDSARIAVNAYNAYKLQGKDTADFDNRFVNEGQTNAITSAMIVDGAVDNTKLSANSVTSDKIQDYTITRNDVATNFKAPLADTADYARIIPGVIDSARVAANAHKLQGKDTSDFDLRYVNENQTNAITTDMLQNQVVTNAKLAPNSVSTDKIINGTIGTIDLEDEAVTADKLERDAVRSYHIMDGTITRSDVALNFKAPYADTADYVRNVSIQYVDSARIAVDAHNAYKLQGKDTVALSNKFVDEGQTNAITSVMIVDNAITSAKIQDGTIQLIDLAFTPATRPLTPPVSNAEIQDNAITSSKIQDGTILRQDVASNFKSPYADTADYVRNVSIQYVDSARIAVDAHNAYKLQGKDTVALSAKFVDEGQPNAITNQMIVNDAITSAKIQDGTIQLDDLSFTPAVRPFSPLISGSEIARPCTLEADVAQYDAVLNVNNTGSGFAIKASANSDAVIVDNAGGAGFVVRNAEHDGYFVGHTNWCGVYVDSADDCGIIISKVAHEGVYIDRAHGAGVFVFNSNGDAFVTHSAGDNGLRVTSAYNHGVLIGRPGQDGLYVDSAGRFGVYVQGAEGGVYGKSIDGFGVKAQSTSGTALIVEGTSEFTGQITSTATDRTAPISVASTAVCPNLNADLLDGYHASELMGTGVYLPLAGGTMTGPITNTGDPEITMGKGNFGSGNINSGTMAFVAGKNNRARGDYSVVSGGGGSALSDSNSAMSIYSTIGGGTKNTAFQFFSTVSGGYQNTANGLGSIVCGGYKNIASNSYATVAGGVNNRARGYSSVVAGGGGATEADSNSAIGAYSAIGGGRRNIASSNCATISGGDLNTASGAYATVSGGFANKTSGSYAIVSGGGLNIASGNYASVTGGFYDTAYAHYSGVFSGYYNLAGNELDDSCAVVTGGRNNQVTAAYAFIGGGRNNRARGQYSVVAGGGGPTLADSNSAIGYYATVSGGTANSASGWGASVGGGWGNWAQSLYATVSGGAQNYANYSRATVSGGQGNIADNEYTTIGGGFHNMASGPYSTVSGGYYNFAGNYATVAGGYCDSSSGNYSFTTNSYSNVPSAYNNSAAFNGQTASASGQLRCGALVGNSKSFQIDHPLDPNGKFLNHFSVESPKMLVTYDGVAIIGSDGRVEVNLPDYFSALTKEPRIQLTGVGTADVYVAEDINGNQFVIGGKPNTKVYWQVSAERKDVSAEITKILMPVEQEKTGELQNVSADDNYLMSTLDQLKAMGYGDRFNFRTAKGRARYEHMHKIEHEVEIKH